MRVALERESDQIAAYWRRALAHSQQLAFVLDTQRRLVAVSRGLGDALGVELDSLVGRRCSSIMHAHGATPLECPLRRALIEGEQREAAVHSDVLGKDLVVTVTPLPDADGQTGYVLHVIADVTAGRAMEAALRESEAKLMESQRIARLGHYVYDIPAGMWTSSPALDEVFGIDAEYERSVDGWLHVIHPDDRADMAAYLQQHVLRDRLPFDREYRVRRIADGAVRWVHGRGTLVEGPSGELTRMSGVIQDVTEARESRSALEKSACLLEEAESLAHLGSWEWDVATDVTRYSREWRRICGVDREELRNSESRRLVHPADVARIDAAADKVARQGLAYHAAYRIIRQTDGEIRHVEVFGQPVLDAGGNVVKVYGASLDVTERVAATEALREREARVQRTLVGTVSSLIATVEMRDPYTAGHQHRVAELAVAMAHALGWSDQRVDHLHIAAHLHDIGKVVVPAEILTKPTRLSHSEFELIKDHAAAAGEILKSVELGEPVRDAIVQHHERLDGSGYPTGLRGDQVIPEARVIAVADVFEAMVSHRPYRPALPVQAAAEELRAGAGVRYDAEAVDACLSLVEGGFAFSTVV